MLTPNSVRMVADLVPSSDGMVVYPSPSFDGSVAYSVRSAGQMEARSVKSSDDTSAKCIEEENRVCMILIPRRATLEGVGFITCTNVLEVRGRGSKRSASEEPR